MFGLLKSLWDDESGQALVEYGLVVGLIAVALVAVAIAFRGQIQALFERMGAALDTAGT